jgi:hypothetical protein
MLILTEMNDGRIRPRRLRAEHTPLQRRFNPGKGRVRPQRQPPNAVPTQIRPSWAICPDMSVGSLSVGLKRPERQAAPRLVSQRQYRCFGGLSALWVVVSKTSSADSGSSYDESMPEQSGICPARALACRPFRDVQRRIAEYFEKLAFHEHGAPSLRRSAMIRLTAPTPVNGRMHAGRSRGPGSWPRAPTAPPPA